MVRTGLKKILGWFPLGDKAYIILSKSDTAVFLPELPQIVLFPVSLRKNWLYLGTMWYKNHVKLSYWIVSAQWGCEHKEFIFLQPLLSTVMGQSVLIDISGRFHIHQSLQLIKVHFKWWKTFFHIFKILSSSHVDLSRGSVYYRRISGRERRHFLPLKLSLLSL